MVTENNTSNFFLAENLRALRKRMNWSQEEFADQIGLNRGNIASYENGTAEPKICNLLKFAHLFSISVFDLTHSDLKDEESYTRASRGNQDGKSMMQPPSLERVVKEAEDIQSAVKGLHCLFRLKTGNLAEMPPECQVLKDHFEQLYSVTQHLLDSHHELISFIQSKCSEYKG